MIVVLVVYCLLCLLYDLDIVCQYCDCCYDLIVDVDLIVVVVCRTLPLVGIEDP